MESTRGSDPAAGEKPVSSVVKVAIDRELCIGAGNCLGIAPDLFYLDDERKAALVSDSSDEVSKLLDAAWSCPTDAISILAEDGSRIYPPPERRSYLRI